MYKLNIIIFKLVSKLTTKNQDSNKQGMNYLVGGNYFTLMQNIYNTKYSSNE